MSIHSVKFLKKPSSLPPGTSWDHIPLDNQIKNYPGCLLTWRALTNRWQSTPKIEAIFVFSSKERFSFTKIAHSERWYLLIFGHVSGGCTRGYFHRLCFLPHAAFLYVDDLLWIQETTIIGLSAAVIAILCLLTGLPISWKKCELGSCIVWIGWSFHIRSGFVSLPESKRQKLLDLLQKLQSSSHCSRKTLEKFLGLALWVTQLWPDMRIWLHNLYRDLHSIPASQFSVDPGNWDQILACISDDLIFHIQTTTYCDPSSRPFGASATPCSVHQVGFAELFTFR